MITKLMATRLQRKIIPLIHRNQYGFIKTRSIQDCLAWAYEYLHQCHQTKEKIIILKLDFAKAFDTVEHSVILSMLQHLGFSEKWCKWVKNILSSASTSILLNGVPGNTIQCKRGVRQGDPLSPLLFVLAADLLQVVVNKAMHMGLVTPPLAISNEPVFPLSSMQMTPSWSWKLHRGRFLIWKVFYRLSQHQLGYRLIFTNPVWSQSTHPKRKCRYW